MSDASVRIVFTGNAASATAAAKQVEGSFTAIGRSMRLLAGIGVGVGIVKGLRAAGSAAIDFDRSMRNVNSIARLGERDFQALSKQVLALAGPTAQAPKTLADGLYDIVSSGFEAGDAIKVLEVSAKAATAGMTSTATASKAVTAALNAYNLEASDAREVSDVLFQTVNKGVLTFEELAQNMGDLVPVSAPLGVSLEEVGAAIATITLQGVPAAEAATRVKNAMLQLSNPSDALKDLMKEWGFETGQAAIQALGYEGVLRKLEQATGGNTAAIQKLFPEQRAALGILGLLTRDTKLYSSILKDMDAATSGAGATQRAFNEQSKSLSFQWQRAEAALTAAAIPIAQLLFPALVKGAQAVANFAGKVESALPEIRARFHEVAGVVTDVARALFDFGRSQVGSSLLSGAAAAFTFGRAISGVASSVQALTRLPFGGWITGALGVVGLLTSALVYLAQQGDAAEQAIRAIKAALDELTNQGEQLKQSQDAAAAAVDNYRTSLDGVAAARENLAAVNESIRNGDITGADATRARAQAERALEQALRGRNQAARDAVQAERELREQERATRESARESAGVIRDVIDKFAGAQAMIDAGARVLEGAFGGVGRGGAGFGSLIGNLDQLRSAMKAAQQQTGELMRNMDVAPAVRKLASQFNGAAKDILKFVDAQGRMPRKVEVDAILRSHGLDPKNLDGILKRLLNLGRTKVQPVVELRETAKGKIREIDGEIKRLLSGGPKKLSIEAQARLEKLQEAKRSLQAFIKETKGAKNLPPVILRLVNRDFNTRMDKAKSALKDLSGETAEPKVEIDPAPALRSLGVIQGGIDGLLGRTVWITVSERRGATVRRAMGGFIPHLIRRAVGGFIPGAWSDAAPDTVPAMLKPGELVLNRPQQNMLGGPAFLAKMFGFTPPADSGVQHFAGGGFVSGFQSRLKQSAARDRKNSGYKAKLKAVEGLQRRLDANRDRQDRMARSIGQDETEYGISVEEFIRVDADGNEILDTGAVAQRLGEIDKLVARKNKLIGLINEETEILSALIAALDAAVKAYQAEIRDQQRVIREMTDLIKDATSKMKDAPDEAKAQYERIISTAETRRDNARSKIEELRGEIDTAREDKRGVQKDRRDQPLDIRDVQLEIRQLQAERAEVAATQPRPPEPTSEADSAAAEAAGADVGGTTGDTGTGGPDLSAQNAVLEAVNAALKKQLSTLRLALGIESVQLPIVGSFAQGTSFVAQTGLAMVHRGEQIIPATNVAARGGYQPSGHVEHVIVELVVDKNLEKLIDARVQQGAPRVSIAMGREIDRRSRAGESGTTAVRRLG